MRTVFVDSNLFLRILTQDDREQSERADRLLQAAAAGTLRLVTGPPVLFEIAWSLARTYRHSQPAILVALKSILSFPNLTVTDAPVVEEALSLAEERSLSFADAYIVALAASAGADEIATFNRRHFEGAFDLHPLQ